MENVRFLKLSEFLLRYEMSNEDFRRLVEWMPNMRVVTVFLNDHRLRLICQRWKELRKLVALGVTSLIEE